MRDMRALFRPAFILISVLIIGMLFILRTQASSMRDTVSYRPVVIEEGDTLSTVYSRYRDFSGFSRAEFMDHVVEVNHLRDADHIHYDMYILIPYLAR